MTAKALEDVSVSDPSTVNELVVQTLTDEQWKDSVRRVVKMKAMWQAADPAERTEFLNFLQEQGVQIREADISFGA